MKTSILVLSILSAFNVFGQESDGRNFRTSFDIPLIDDSPATESKLDFDHFEKISQILYSSRMAPHLNCRIAARTTKSERKFLSGKREIVVLEIDYSPRSQYSPRSVKFKIPMDLATFGSKVVANQWSGSGEDIKIEMNDTYGHWIRFTHDGRGQIVQINVGNNMANYPCTLKD